MNYSNIYNSLIQRAISLPRKKYKPTHTDYVCYEKHHIIPECFFINRTRPGPRGHLHGNPNDLSNIVLLTPEEHYLAHLLLVKIYPGNHKLVRAASMMCVNTQGTRLNNKSYAWLKRLDASAKSAMQTGIKTGPNKKKGTGGAKRKGIKTGRKTLGSTGKVPWNKDKKSTVPSPKKGIPSGKKGITSEKKGTTVGPRKRVVCPHCNHTGCTPHINLYHFDNCANNPANNGVCSYVAPERKLQEFTCPHCNKTGKTGAMKQHHFDRCKFRI